jgi:hypothetical protein
MSALEETTGLDVASVIDDADLTPLPIDRSDDLALDLLSVFYSSPDEFVILAQRLVEAEMLLRVETTTRLFWHMNSCVETQVARNLPLGLEPDEVREQFLTSTRAAVLEHLGNVNEDLLADALTDLAAISFADAPYKRAITLFSPAAHGLELSVEELTAKVCALAGQVSAMRLALDLS